MSGQDATSDYLEFLQRHGRISHVVSAPPEHAISTLALTQRCLASGIDFPVPLPDGRVAIKVEGEVPRALAALDLVIERLEDAAASERAISDLDWSGEDAFFGASPREEPQERKLQENADIDAVPTAATGPTDVAADVNAWDASDLDEVDSSFAEKTSGALPHDAEPAPADSDNVQDTAADEPFDGGDDDSADVPPMFMRAFGRSAEAEALRADDLAEVTEAEDDLAGDLPAAADMTDAQAVPDEEAPSSGDAAGLDDQMTDDAPHKTSAAAAEPAPEQLDRILVQLDALQRLSDSGAEATARLTETVEALSRSVGALASRPVPRPDTSDFNRGMARMTAALAQTMRRLDMVIERAAPDEDGIDGAGIAEALAGGFASLAEAIRAANAGGAVRADHGQPDLSVIASMQETMGHQLAKLIEAQASPKPPELEEFLLDLRHATAELLAEQARLAKAG